ITRPPARFGQHIRCQTGWYRSRKGSTYRTRKGSENYAGSMKTAFNPFPDYPVAKLTDDSSELFRSTIPTRGIDVSRELVQGYVAQWRGPRVLESYKPKPTILAVEGDYGTGKTHLLLDALAQFQQAFIDTFPEALCLRFACLEADILSWYRI